MNFHFSINADSAAELQAALAELAGLLSETAPAPAPREANPESKPRRGRPARNAETVEAPVNPELPNAGATGSAEPPEAAQAQPKTEAAVPAAALERKDVQKLLVAVVQKHGVDACSAICKAHGGPNLSALDPSTYPSVVAACKASLAAEVDPAA